PRYAPSRTLLPPGTMRMPFSGPMRCMGYVFLSRKLSAPTDMSTLMPMRKPTRMPFLTQALTRQPVAVAASGSAARIRPSVSAMRKAAKTPLSSGVYSAGLLSKSRSISACMVYQESRGFEHGLDFGQAGLAGRHHGKPPDGLQQAHQRHRGFHRNGVGLHEDHAASPERGQRDGDGVVAGKHDEIGGDFVQHGRHLADVAAGFLDAYDVVELGEARQSAGLQVDAGAPLHAVDDDGQAGGRRNRAVVLVEAFLGGFVVIGGDGEDAVGAQGFDLVGEFDDLVGVVASGPGEHGDLALGFFERDLDHAQMLGTRECGAFAGGTAGDKKIDAGRDLTAD